MSQVLISGSVAYDRIMDFPGLFKDSFLPDKLHNINVSFAVEGFAENFGGTAGNIGYNLALLGIEPKIISTAGSDFERYKAHFKSLNIDPASVHVDLKNLTSSAFIMTDKADNQIAAFSFGAGNTPYEPLPLTEGIVCAHIGAGCPRDMQVLPEHYRSHGVSYFYDPAQQIPTLGAEDLKNGITGATVLFGNDYEIGLLMEKTGWDEQELLTKVPAIIITYGEKGTRILTEGKVDEVLAAPAKEVVDPTGAGDAYRAGFIAGFLHALPVHQCARLGSIVSVYAVEKYGTQNHRFTREELAIRYKETYGEDCPLK